MYILLIKLMQNPDNLNNTDGWQVSAITRDLEKVREWHEQSQRAVAEDAIEAYHVVGTEWQYV